ncbi:RNA-binding domain-containing protein [Eubacterium xylanophilum]|uniref:RNA-binding domain-containing protein n=1 Tax=Eubacterium xylanophilum TaxID=39497 RepID=UPI00047C6513|nr:RNA-binding domain-containing protein [Eubacterium xylanophilum]
MAESQNIEYKESWRDEYLKWLCGFANAQGGTIYIGVDDAGDVVGVKDVKKLMEDIPNKIQSGLGIVADVNKLTKDGKDYLEIKVKPSSFPISYHGEFHYRSGSTKQQLTGIALSEFIMQKTGFRWEDVTVDNITVDDLDDESFKIFRREALSKKRMSEAELNVSNAELLKKLHLIVDGKLKRSAVLLFYKDPEIIQNGSFVKVGKFDERGRVVYHNDLEESLIVNASKVIDLIYQMYLKAKISYEHDIRVEEYPFAREAIREAVYNAIAHNCYMYGTPIQIRIMDDAITISNSCILPEGWTVDTLMEPHESKPYNPDIARVFYRAGFIENWGQGIQKICGECKGIGAELPVYELTGTTLRIRFKALESALIDQPNTPNRQNGGLSGGIDGGLAEKIIELIRADETVKVSEMAESLGIPKRTIEREMKRLRDSERISREGGNRYGRWKIKQEDKVSS